MLPLHAGAGGTETSDSADSGDSGDSTATADTAEGEDGSDGGSDGEETAAESEEESGDASADEESTAQDDGATTNDETNDASGGEADGGSQKSPAKAAVAVKRIDKSEASASVMNGDALATDRAINALNLPDLSGRQAPSSSQISNFLQQLRQRVTGGSAMR